MASGFPISVIICTHNPKQHYLQRVMEAIRNQTLPVTDWELLLIDNASASPLSELWDTTWHKHSRIIREEKLGLTPARLRGVVEAIGEVLVFVDDDNLLDPHYLSETREIAIKYPFLGAWGSGQIIPEFESAPPTWAKPYLGMLALREVNSIRWSNLDTNTDSLPWGAGLCVRAPVAHRYRQFCISDVRRAGLDRQGTQLLGCGDMDLAWTACDLGLGTGLFPSLKLTHLIPAGRLVEDYLVALQESNVYSTLMLTWVRHGSLPAFTPRGWLGRLADAIRWCFMSRIERRMRSAYLRGRDQAIAACRQSSPL